MSCVINFVKSINILPQVDGSVVYVDACWNPFLIAMGMHESHKGYKK